MVYGWGCAGGECIYHTAYSQIQTIALAETHSPRLTSPLKCHLCLELEHSVYSFYAPVAWALRKLPHIYHVSHRKLTKPTSLPWFPRDVTQPQQDTKAYLFLCMIGYCFYLLFLHYTGLGNFSLKDSPRFSMFVSV